MKPYFDYKDNELYAENTKISAIAEKTPFFCYSLSALKDNFNLFNDEAKNLGLDYTICYAMKANFNPHIIKIFADMGAGADIVSGGELYLAKKCNISPRKIVFSGIGKTIDEIDEAINDEVLHIAIESESEADMVIDRAKALNKKPSVALRVNPDVDAITHQKITTGKKENKFGISFTEALRIYRKLKASGYVNADGISLHIGSQLLNCEPFEKAFRKILNFLQTLKDNDIIINHIDVGGGIGIKYANFSEETHNEKELIHKYMKIIKNSFGALNKKIIFEPGRFLIGNTGILVTKIIHLKDTLEKKFIIIDAGMNDLMRPAMYNAWHEVLPVKKRDNSKVYTFDVVGPICESSDVFATQRKIELPSQNDLLAIMSAGAYGSSMSSNYNFRPLIAEILIDDKKIAVIRKKQSFEDILNNY